MAFRAIFEVCADHILISGRSLMSLGRTEAAMRGGDFQRIDAQDPVPVARTLSYSLVSR